MDEEVAGGAEDVVAGAVDEEVTRAVGEVCEGGASEEGEPSMAVVQCRRVPRRAACRTLAGWKH